MGVRLFSCNDWYDMYSANPDYWVTASSIFRINNRQDVINKYKVPVLYSKSADVSTDDFVEKNIQVDYFGYLSSYINKQPGDIEIGEQLQKYTGNKDRYGGGDTVALHMLSFAILMGCTKIYMFGIDLDYRLGYANSGLNGKIANVREWDEYLDRLNSMFNTIAESGQNIGVKIHNLSIHQFSSIEKMDTLDF
jgi:hypothetical protein